MNKEEDFNALEKDIQDFYLLICDNEEKRIINVVESKTNKTNTISSTSNDDDVTKKNGKKKNSIQQHPVTTTTDDDSSSSTGGTATAIVEKKVSPVTTTTTSMTAPFEFENNLKENAQISKTFVKLIKAYWEKEDFTLKTRVLGGGAKFSSRFSAASSKMNKHQQEQQQQQDGKKSPKIEDYFRVEKKKKKTNGAIIDVKNLTLEFIVQKIFLIQKEVDDVEVEEDEDKEKNRVRLLKSFSSELYESLSFSKEGGEGGGGGRKKDKGERGGGKNDGEEEYYFSNSKIEFISIYSMVWLICVWINIEMKSKNNAIQYAAPSILKRYFSFKNLNLSIGNLKENVESKAAANVFLSLSPNRIWKSVEFSNNKNKVEAILLYEDENGFFSESFFKKMSDLLEFSDENAFFQKYVKTGRIIAFNTRFCRTLKIFSFAVESILFDITEQREASEVTRETTTTTATTTSIATADGSIPILTPPPLLVDHYSAFGLDENRKSEQPREREREHEKEKEDELQQQHHVEQFRTHILMFGIDSKLFFQSLPKSLQQKYKENNITNNLDNKGASKEIINIFQKINLL